MSIKVYGIKSCDTMKKTFLFKSTGFDGVCIFNFDRNEDAA